MAYFMSFVFGGGALAWAMVHSDGKYPMAVFVAFLGGVIAMAGFARAIMIGSAP